MAKQVLKTVKNSVKNWYIPFVVGLIFIGMGLYSMFSPVESFSMLSKVLAFSFITSGIAEIMFSFNNREELENWGWTLIFGLVTLLVGLLIFNRPEITFNTLSLFVGITIMFRSISAISYAIDLKKHDASQWKTLLLFGILGVIFSFILLWNPLLAGSTVAVLMGLALIAVGAFSVFLSLKLKKLKKASNTVIKGFKEKADTFSDKLK